MDMDYDTRMMAWAIARNMSKGELMKFIYGEDYQGIDSALPQGWVDANGLSYGAEEPKKDLFFYCVNYNENRCGQIEYMPVVAEKMKLFIGVPESFVEYRRGFRFGAVGYRHSDGRYLFQIDNKLLTGSELYDHLQENWRPAAREDQDYMCSAMAELKELP
jgi:hypothetical protein